MKISSPDDEFGVDAIVFVDNKDDKLDTLEDTRTLGDAASFEADDIRPSEPIAEYEICIKTKYYHTKRKTQKKCWNIFGKNIFLLALFCCHESHHHKRY